MEAIDAIEIETCCLKILDRVTAKGEPVILLKGGQPVAELRPLPRSSVRYPQHELKGTVVELGDIVEPALAPKHQD